MEYYNQMAPFPIYDTSYIEDLKITINKMEDKKNSYDDEPVVACKYCKSLHIRTDDVGNDHCYRCGSDNELIEFKTIHDYNKFINDKNSQHN